MGARIFLHPAWLGVNSIHEIVMGVMAQGLQLTNWKAKSGRILICLEPIDLSPIWYKESIGQHLSRESKGETT